MSDILTAASDTPVKWDSTDTSFSAASDTPIKWDAADAEIPVQSEAPVKFTPDEIESSDQNIKFGLMHQAGVHPFLADSPNEDDIGYGRWLEKNGHLSNPDAPGFFSSLGHMVYETAAGLPEVVSQAYQYRKAKLFGTDKEVADAEKRSDALAASYGNSLSTMYKSMGIGASRISDKSRTNILSVAAEFEGDPAFKSRIKATDDASWYKYMRRMTVLGDENKVVQDAATKMAIDAGWSKEGLENATATATFAGDPLGMALGPVMGVAGKGMSAIAGKAASALGVAGSKTVALGAADALRAEIALGAKNISSLEQFLERIPYATESVGAEAAQEIFEQTTKQLAAANAAQAAKNAALKTLDAENIKILSEMGRPSVVGRVAGAAGVKVASAVEKAGTFLAEMNQGVVDKVLTAVEADTASSAVGNIAKRMAPTAIVGGVIGAASSNDTTTGFIQGAATGAALPSTLANAGRLSRILGENYLIGRTTTPYFAKMATEAEANGLEKWAFRKLNTFSPVFDFSKNVAAASAKGAAVGAGFGYVSSGGEGGDMASAAAGGVAGHFTPWAAISSVHGFWSPVRSAAEFNNMQASNLRLLQDRWKGSDNLDRLSQLNPSQQLSVASVVSANPDVTLRLTTTDKNVIAADQLARGQVPQDVSNVPGFHYKDPISGRSVIVLNPDHPDAMKPVLAHEFWHKAQSEGLSQSIVSELVGDSALGLPGMYTKMENGAPVRRADGSFEVTKEFADAKAEYLRRLSSKGVEHSITDAEFALEHAAEQGSDYVMGGRFNEAIRPTIGSMMLDLLPDAVRNAVGTAGGALAPDGSIRGTMNLGLKPSPAVQKLFDSYMKDWRVGRNKATAEEAGRGLEISREQILKNPDILHSFKASGGINVDSGGNIAGTRVNPETGKLEIVDAKKVFKTSAQMAKEQAELTQMVMEAVRNAKDTGSDADAVKITTENGREVAYGKYLSPETLAWIENSGKFNPFQLEHIKNLNALTKSGTGDYVRFFYQPATKGGKYDSIKGHWREEVPYSWHISKAENILFRTVSYDKVAGNLEKLWSKETERASGLWTSQVSMLSDAKKYLENLSQGKPGETELTVEKKKFINIALGINTSDRASSNALYDADAHRRLTSFVTARRIDRTNRMTPPERGDKLPWSYEAYSRGRFNMTAGDADISGGENSTFQFSPGTAEPRKIDEVAKELGLSEVGEGAKKFGYFMHEMKSKGLTPRDVLKAYLITTSSINRRAVPTEKIAKNWEGLSHEETDLRPEDAFAKLLGTNDGKQFLDDAVNGTFNEAAANAMLDKFKPFGLYNTQREYMRNAAENLSKISQEIISAVGEMSSGDYADFVRENFKGISYGKVGFMSGMLGRGDLPTVDVRERKLWYGGKDVKVDKKILTQVRDSLSGLGIELHEDLKQFYQTVIHHAVWDKLEGTDTSHADIKTAMLQFTPGSEQPKSAVEGYTPTAEIKDVPEITLSDLRGKKLFPIIADLTAVGRYLGINSAAVVPVDLYGGPEYPLMAPSKDAGVVWANEGKGIGTRKTRLLEQSDGYAVVTAMSQNAHASNTSTVRAYINTLEAYVKDGRVSEKGIAEADAAIANLTSEVKQKIVDSDGEYARDKKGKIKTKTVEQPIDLPSVSDPAFGDAVRSLSFDARKAVVGQLERAKFEEYGFPPAKRVLDEVRGANFHGMDIGDSLLVIKLDRQNTLVKLGQDGVPAHPDYSYGVRGQIVGRLKRPIPSKLMFSEFYDARRQAGASESSDPRSFSLKMPVTEVTDAKIEVAKRLEETVAQNPQQMRAALSAATDSWSTSDTKVNEGGVGVADFVRAIRENKGSASLTPYSESAVKEKIKKGDMRVFKLNNAEIYFALLKDGEKSVISSVVNNEPGARGIAMPAVMSKAIQEGATHLDCFAVKSDRYPNGKLPEAYSLYGFEEDPTNAVGSRVDFSKEFFDADVKSAGENPDFKFADLLHSWQSEGWNPSTPKPQVVFMRLHEKFTSNDSRQNYSRRLLEQTAEPLADRGRATRRSVQRDAQPNPAGAGEGGAGRNNSGTNRGVEGADRGASASDARSASNAEKSLDSYRAIVRDLAGLTDADAKFRGIDLKQLNSLRELLSKDK